MTDDDLQAIEARASAATRGPWVNDKDYRVNVAGGTILETKHFEASVGEDCAFIANAREDVPALVAEVKRLLAIEKETRQVLVGHIGTGVLEAEGLLDVHVADIARRVLQGLEPD